MVVKPGYKQTEVGIIPEEWEVKPLQELCIAVLDCHHSTPVWTKAGAVVIRNQNIRDGKLDLSEASFTNDQHFAERTRRATPMFGDLVITREAPMGLVCMIPEGLRCCLGQRMVLLRINCEKASSTYVLYALLGEDVQRSISVAGGTGSTVSNLRIPVLKQLKIFVPGLPEQEAIATVLSDVDALLSALERLLAKKRDLKQASMQQLLSGQIRLPGFHSEWVVTRLGALAQLSKIGVNPSSMHETLFTHFSLPAFDASETPVIETGASIGSNKFVVPQNAVLLSKLNPRIPRIWAPADIPNNSVCSTEFLVLKPNPDVDRQFLKYVCLSPRVCAQMELHAIGTTGSHQRIQPNQAMSIEIACPKDSTEQTAIATVLTDMDSELDALEQRLVKTRALKQGMMQELLSGRTRLL